MVLVEGMLTVLTDTLCALPGDSRASGKVKHEGRRAEETIGKAEEREMTGNGKKDAGKSCHRGLGY